MPHPTDPPDAPPSPDARRVRFDQLMTEADQHLQAGRFDAAVEHYAAAAQLARDGGALVELGTALHRASVGRDRGGVPEEAAWFARQALSVDQQVFGPVHPAVARDLHSLGVILARSGQPAEAVPHLRRSADISERFQSPRERVTTLLALGQALHRAGEPAEAAPVFSEAAELATQADQPQGRHAIRALLSLAGAQAAAGQLAGAHTTWTELTRRLAGRGTPPPVIASALAQAWQGLGTLALRARGDHQDAAWMFAFALWLAPTGHPVRRAAQEGLSACGLDPTVPREAGRYVVVAAPPEADRFDVASPTGGRFTLTRAAVPGPISVGRVLTLHLGADGLTVSAP